MRVVIDIPDNVYKFVTTECKDVAISETKAPIEYIIRGIIDGTPLPKGHGDLIDTNVLILELDKYNEYATFDCNAVKDLIDETPTIIEADKRDNE